MADDKKQSESRKVTIEEFVENGPLFSTFDSLGSFTFPTRLTRDCSRCKKETTWLVQTRTEVHLSHTYQAASYRCGLCENDYFAAIVRPTEWIKKTAIPTNAAITYTPSKYEKVGQYPRPSIKVPRNISDRLGDSADLYEKALICRNHGFGIAALAYARRVVEDKTNELIEVVEDLATASGIAEDEIAKIHAARVGRATFDEKLKLASQAIPAALRPDGVNPIGLLYGLISEGLHGKSEQECLEIADEIRDIFEYVFGQLRAQVEDQKGFVTKVKKWAGGQKKAIPAEPASPGVAEITSGE